METASMVFCAQCGQPTGERDAFCGHCGARQPGAAGVPPPAGPANRGGNPIDGISDRTASMLCYVPFLGIIMCIIVLASERFRAAQTDARFHAFQGLFLFVTYQILDKVLRPMLSGGLPFFFGSPVGLMKLALVGVGVYMIIATSQGERVSLPLIGELADKSASERGL